jgi:tetratricopeptide (TPR) repeat protein
MPDYKLEEYHHLPSSQAIHSYHGGSMLHFSPDNSEMIGSEKLDCRKQVLVEGKLIFHSQDIDSCDEALQIDPHDCVAWYDRGKELDDSGFYEEALAYYHKALEIRPNYTDAWNSLGGILCDQLQRYPEALFCFEQALKFDCLDNFSWYNRGNVLENLERYEEAIASYDLALRINPGDEATWYGRGWALYELENFEEAIRSYEQALKLKPTDDSAWYTKACCHALLGEVISTIECLLQAISLSPNQYRQMVKDDEDFDDIRDDMRFRALMEELLIEG